MSLKNRTIGLNKETTRCSVLPGGDEARQDNGTKDLISVDDFGVPAVVSGRRGMRRVSVPEPLA